MLRWAKRGKSGAKKEVVTQLWCCYGEVTEMLRGGTDEAVYLCSGKGR